MAIVNTHLFTISFAREDIIELLLKVEALKDEIFPQDAKKIAKNVKGVSLMDASNPYIGLLESLEQIMIELNIERKLGACLWQEQSTDAIQKIVDDIDGQIQGINKIKNNLELEYQENLDTLQLLKDLRDSDIDIDEIKECEYLTFRFGRIPISKFDNLEYFKEAFIFTTIHQDEDYVSGIFVALNRDIYEIDNIFYGLSFEQIELPVFVHGTIDQAIIEIKEEIQAMKKFIMEAKDELEKIRMSYHQQLQETYMQIACLKGLFDHNRYIVDFSSKLCIYAFSTLTKEDLEKQFKGINSVSLLELPSTMYHDQGIVGPIKMEQPSWVEPFSLMVKPKPGDSLDPTWILAILAMISAAILVGDIAVGIAFMIVSYIINRKKQNQGIGLYMGMAITIGGLLHGTIGYNIALYPAIWPLPIAIMQSFAIWIGFLVILICVGKIAMKISRRNKIV